MNARHNQPESKQEPSRGNPLLKHEKVTEEIREIAALYALGSLTQHEARSFEAHIQEGCAICKAEFRHFEHIVAGIGLASEEIAAPEYLHELLSKRIERESQAAQSAPVSSEGAGQEPEQEKDSRPYSPPPLFSQSMQRQGAQRKGFLPWVLTALFACLAILAFFVWRSALKENSQLRTEVSAAQAEGEDLKRLLDNQRLRREELEQVLTIAGKSDARFMRLSGQDPAPSASAILLWDFQEAQCLTFGFLPPPPQGYVYQLWFVTTRERIPAGLLNINPTGRTFTVTPVPVELANWVAAVVTLEPEGGSQTPTTDYYLLGRF